ncbi:hypothetical protein [Methylovirgula sp. HY1]|uniref:hypothetical protein n=1 Tax=Methylovirgula sp. HY1 TaxID=2822761 RepID=UPI001C5AF361|nr:hypothetical protein [Methylovirgula sp. HY1]QXX76279.1 hypothetical protein MHY1_03119 [Methylovirgula sp. HY1]
MIYVRPLYAFIAVVLVGTPIARAEDLTTASHPPRALENPLATISLDQLRATQERPLFAPARRRPSAPVLVSHAPPPPPEPPKLSLSGVVFDKKGPIAIVRTDPNGKPMHVRLGDAVGGWRVTQIKRQRLVISLDDRSAIVKMFKSDHGDKQVAERDLSDHVRKINAADALKPHRGH